MLEQFEGGEKRDNMDPTILLQRSKYLKFTKKPNTGDSEDIISKLPDCILNSILSLLPTKDAIRTSLLSTRWRHLSTSLSHIDLDDGFTYKASFFNFVERVLLLHDASDIKSFRLRFSRPVNPSCVSAVNPSRVHSWVSAVVKHKVEEIYLSLPLGISLSLPCYLFTCQSLVVLKIRMHGVLKVPTVVNFPSLKILALSNVILSNEDPIERLLSNCPVLQDLAFDFVCRWENIKRVTISIPTLKRFSFSAVSKLTDIALDCRIEIYASNLVFLQYASDFKLDCVLYDLPSSVDASIEIRNLHEEVVDRALHLLNSVQNVKSLSVTGEGYDYVEAGELAAHVSTFNKLTTLGLELTISRFEIGLLMDFLNKAPTLEFLEITVMDLSVEVFNEDWELDVVPCCFKSHLKTIDISFCNGYKKEMHLVKLLLKNTAVLERMMIYVWDDEFWEDSELVEQVHNQVQMLPRGSESCVIQLLES